MYRDRRIAIIALLGFSSGLPLALTFSTLTFWLVESGVTKSAIGLFAAVSSPYSLKFLWAPLMDHMRLSVITRALGRRRGWIVFTQAGLIGALLWLGTTDPSVNAWATALAAVTVAFWSASQDIVIDAYRVEILEEHQYAAGAAAVVLGYRIGMLVSGAGALFLATQLTWFQVYAVMACLVLVGTLAALVGGEPEVAPSSVATDPSAGLAMESGTTVGARLYVAVVEPFSDFMLRRGWAAVLLFVVLFKLGDALAGVMTNPFLIEMGFSKTEIATVVKTYGLFATIVGAMAGGALMNSVGLLRSLWICGLLQMFSNLLFAVQAGVGHNTLMLALTIGTENLASGMGTAAFIAFLSSLCNTEYTATQYALLSSLTAVARTLLSTPGGWLADHTSWVAFFVGTTAAAVPGLLLLAWLASTGAIPPIGQPQTESA